MRDPAPTGHDLEDIHTGHKKTRLFGIEAYTYRKKVQLVPRIEVTKDN